MIVKIKKRRNKKVKLVARLCFEIIRFAIRVPLILYGIACTIAATCCYGWFDPVIPKFAISGEEFMIIFKLTAFTYIACWITIRIWQRFIMNIPISITADIDKAVESLITWEREH